MKLSKWSKLKGISYQTAYRMVKSGKLPNSEILPTGTILVHENPKNNNVDESVDYNDKRNSYLYLVGETLNHEIQSWNFQGVYSTEEKAIEKCVKDNFFIARIEIDFDEPVEMREYEYTYYPRLESRPNCG